MIQTRKTKWAQFLLLCVAIGFFFTGNMAWWVMEDDEGNDVYTWPTKIIGIVLGFGIMVVLIWAAYQWLLAWEIGFSGKI